MKKETNLTEGGIEIMVEILIIAKDQEITQIIVAGVDLMTDKEAIIQILVTPIPIHIITVLKKTINFPAITKQISTKPTNKKKLNKCSIN